MRVINVNIKSGKHRLFRISVRRIPFDSAFRDFLQSTRSSPSHYRQKLESPPSTFLFVERDRTDTTISKDARICRAECGVTPDEYQTEKKVWLD